MYIFTLKFLTKFFFKYDFKKITNLPNFGHVNTKYENFY